MKDEADRCICFHFLSRQCQFPGALIPTELDNCILLLKSGEQELTRLREEHAQAFSELEQARAALDEANEHHAGALAELSAQRDGVQQELGAALERLGTLGAAAEDADRLREEVERLEKDLSETQAFGQQELTRLREELKVPDETPAKAYGRKALENE